VTSPTTRHAGRRHPVGASRHRRTTGPEASSQDPQQRWRHRAARRALLVRQAVQDLGRAGDLTHEAVAARTGLPLGQLRWAYPTVVDLAHAGTETHPLQRSSDR
jgi:DNA-binding transcriptional regulator YbjK